MTAPDFEVRNRAELVDALSVAAQVEHIVLLEYLYAAFSCRHTQDATVPEQVQLTSWELARELYAIAHDEMDHLGAVQQLLAALGAPPVPDAWSFPVSNPLLPFPCELTRLDLDAVDRFIRTESPFPTAADAAAVAQPPDPIRFDVLGDLYRAVVEGLRRLGDAAFIGAPVTGPDPSPLTFRNDGLPVASAAEAIATIETVISEGEGSSGADPRGHWQRFVTMRAALEGLSADVERVSWPCVRNPVLKDTDTKDTTRLTEPVTVEVADIANRAYRALWLLLGGTYVHDWSTTDLPQTLDHRRSLQRRSMSAARWVMATVVRPLGELLARLPAFEDQPDGPTAGMCFEQYGEFRVPAQPDARLAASLDELAAIAADLDAVAGRPALSAPWAEPRLRSMAVDVRMIRDRLRGAVPPPPRSTFEPAVPGRWLAVDFAGWYQVRLATGGDPYDDPRGVSGWQFAYPGEPDLDRVLRLQPPGTFLRPHVDPGIAIGVRVTSADLDETEVPALAGAAVDLLENPVFEGHNGVVAADGDEPIVPLHLRIATGGITLERSAADAYAVPHLDLAAIGAVADTPAARALRKGHGLPERVFGDDRRPTQELVQHVQRARARLQAALDEAAARGDEPARRVLAHRLTETTRVWPFGAVVVWRLRLTGTDCVVELPDGVPAPVTRSPWWLELVSTGFDQDAGCALMRGVLHAPVTANAGPPAWRMALQDVPGSGRSPMPVDAMGVRVGR